MMKSALIAIVSAVLLFPGPVVAFEDQSDLVQELTNLTKENRELRVQLEKIKQENEQLLKDLRKFKLMLGITNGDGGKAQGNIVDDNVVQGVVVADEFLLTNNVLVCKFHVNPMTDFGLSLSTSKSICVDNEGREFSATRVVLGKESGGYVNNYLVKGVSIRGEVHFTDVPKDIRSIQLLSLYTYGPFIQVKDVEVVSE